MNIESMLTFNCFRSLYSFATVSFGSAFVVLGGYKDGEVELKTAALYSDDQWSKMGNLQKTRHGHGAIIRDNEVYVIGGYGIK